MRTSLALVSSLFSFIITTATGSAQPAPTVKLVIGGGLLGRIEGFCEQSRAGRSAGKSDACPEGSSPQGGVDGLSAAVKAERTEGSVVLLTGNNLSKDYPKGRWDSFLTSLAGIGADVIALGQEDLLRAILPAEDIERIRLSADHMFPVETINYLHSDKGLPFIASNVFLRRHRKNLNKIESNGYLLKKIDADHSVPWNTASLEIQMPTDRPPAQVTLGHHVCQLEQPADCIFKVDGRSLSIPKFHPLTPGASVEIGVDTQTRLRFEVDPALTPRPNPATPSLAAAPVALVASGNSRVAVAALVDPAVLTNFDAARWKCKRCNVSPALMGDQDLEVVVLTIDDTMETLNSRIAGLGALPVLLTDLADSSVLGAATSSTLWKVISYNADSHAFGCGEGPAGCLKGRREPYSFGHVALIDPGETTSRAWVRPEWLGERITIVNATDTAGWHISAVSSKEVAGTPPPPRLLLETRKVSGFPSPPQPDITWAKDRNVFSDVIMDAMRKASRSELAILDQRTVDSDVIREFGREINAKPPRINITTTDLMDLLWRHDAWVRVVLTGQQIMDLMGTLASAPPDDDGGGYCVRGIQVGDSKNDCSSLPKKPVADTLRVNGRFFDIRMRYSIAMPQSLASTLSVDYIKHDQYNVFTATDSYIKKPKNIGLNTSGAKPFISNRYESKWLGMFYIPPASIEVGGQSYHARGNDVSGFQAIPLAGEKPTHTFKFNLAGELHLTPIDLPAFTMDFFTRENLNRLDTYPAKNTDPLQTSYSPDLWTSGAVGSSRWITNRISTAFDRFTQNIDPHLAGGSFRLEPFVGFFAESSIFHFDTQYRAKQKIDSADPNSLGILVTESDRKPLYVSVGAGVGFTDIPLGPYLKLKGTSFRHDEGRNYVQPYMLDIAGVSFDMNMVRRCGVQKLIDGCNDLGTKAVELMGSTPVVRYRYRETGQARNQLASTAEFTFGPAQHKSVISLSLKGNLWGAAQEGRIPLDPLWSVESQISLSVPVYAGISIGPYARYYLVKAFGAPGTFESRKFGFTATVPFFSKAGHGGFFW